MVRSGKTQYYNAQHHKLQTVKGCLPSQIFIKSSDSYLPMPTSVRGAVTQMRPRRKNSRKPRGEDSKFFTAPSLAMATAIPTATARLPLPWPGVPETPQFRPLYAFFSFDTFPRSSNLVNRYRFYPLKLFSLSTCEAILPVFIYYSRTPILRAAA